MYTRTQYLNNECSHEVYYSQFVTDSILKAVIKNLGKQILISKDPDNFNDISLGLWDRLSYIVPGTHSLAEKVCILKQAARLYYKSINPS